MDLLTRGFMAQCVWMSFIHTFSTLGSFQLEAGVGPGDVDGQKIQIFAEVCPPCVPRDLASSHCTLTLSQSLQTLGKHSCAFGKVL